MYLHNNIPTQTIMSIIVKDGEALTQEKDYHHNPYPNEHILKYPYGTSGFRFHEDIMMNIADKIGQAIGIIILMQNKEPSHPKHFGVMITASHNPYTDNGIKLIDDKGFMMTQEIERRVMEQIVNDHISIDEILDHIQQINPIICPGEMYQIIPKHRNVYLFFGTDTRRSCSELKRLIFVGTQMIINKYNNQCGSTKNNTKDSTKMINLRMVDLGMRTTPETHVCVMRCNLYEHMIDMMYPSDNLIIDLSNNIRYPLSSHYVLLIQGFIKKYNLDLSHVVVDCANGVGSVTLDRVFTGDIEKFGPTIINRQITNHKKLNDGCGSDHMMNFYTQHHKMLLSLINDLDDINPYNDKNEHKERTDQDRDMIFRPNTLHASFDGDADRIILYLYDETKINVLTGDHMSYLILGYIVDSLMNSEKYDDDNGTNPSTELKVSRKKPTKESISIGVVHTGYSNGGFVDAIDKIIGNPNLGSNIKIHRLVAPIGVKNLIDMAKQYDIGIYFESNGHGSVMVNNHHGIKELVQISELFNSLIGDAIMNLIGLCHIIQQTDSTYTDMLMMFKEKESRTVKIIVADKNIYKTSHDQTKLLEPVLIAHKLDNLLTQTCFEGCRAFVRPSGTEDILRLYVENNSTNSSDLNLLIKKISIILK